LHTKKKSLEQRALNHVAHARLPSRWGNFTIHASPAGARRKSRGARRGNLKENAHWFAFIRMLTGDVLNSLRCDVARSSNSALKKIAKAQSGVLLYLPQEGAASA